MFVFAYSKYYTRQLEVSLGGRRDDNISVCFLNVFWLLLDVNQVGQKNTKAVA